ncbi:hypothetical protein G5I_03935 [Acromyrmex echinatior]|uniref:Uncharacterized protein n=1 Tax=Acromyrmex echinatior TaxID=103372 RepID=F4WEA3_ACREC|nr:hypothetical protein G5I_03935 [Acromyrmex echinatior]
MQQNSGRIVNRVRRFRQKLEECTLEWDMIAETNRTDHHKRRADFLLFILSFVGASCSDTLPSGHNQILPKPRRLLRKDMDHVTGWLMAPTCAMMISILKEKEEARKIDRTKLAEESAVEGTRCVTSLVYACIRLLKIANVTSFLQQAIVCHPKQKAASAGECLQRNAVRRIPTGWLGNSDVARQGFRTYVDRTVSDRSRSATVCRRGSSTYFVGRRLEAIDTKDPGLFVPNLDGGKANRRTVSGARRQSRSLFVAAGRPYVNHVRREETSGTILDRIATREKPYVSNWDGDKVWIPQERGQIDNNPVGYPENVGYPPRRNVAFCPDNFTIRCIPNMLLIIVILIKECRNIPDDCLEADFLVDLLVRDVFNQHAVCWDKFDPIGWFGSHQNERQLGRQLAAQSSQIKLDLDGIGYDDAESVAHIRRGKQSAGREVALIPFHYAIEGDAATMLITRQGRLQSRTRIDRATILRFNRFYYGSELTVLKDHYVDALLHQRLDLLHHLVAVVTYAYIDSDCLAVIVQLLVQSNLELEGSPCAPRYTADDPASWARTGSCGCPSRRLVELDSGFLICGKICSDARKRSFWKLRPITSSSSRP